MRHQHHRIFFFFFFFATVGYRVSDSMLSRNWPGNDKPTALWSISYLVTWHSRAIRRHRLTRTKCTFRVAAFLCSVDPNMHVSLIGYVLCSSITLITCRPWLYYTSSSVLSDDELGLKFWLPCSYRKSRLYGWDSYSRPAWILVPSSKAVLKNI